MSIYITNDGQGIEAFSSEELVNKLNQMSKFGYKEDIQEYMEDSAKRIEMQFGVKVSTENVDAYVADLLAYNIIKIASA